MISLLGLVLSVVAFAGEDILVADFEGDTYGAWRVEGAAFGDGPAQGTLPGQMAVSGYRGRGLVNSFRGGDGAIGALESPPFPIERRHINFLIGGGLHPEDAYIALYVDGERVRTATGPNDQPGGSEELDWASWDVSEFMGKTAVLRIVDTATAGWGHINVDHIVQSDQGPPRLVTVTRELTITGDYLHFPVRTGDKKRLVTVEVEDGPRREFEIELPESDPEFWVFLEVRGLTGRKATIRAEALPEDSAALDRVECGDVIRDAEDLYREPGRPQFHFSSRRGWLNDPNGLVYLDGEYHLFYQHNPYGRNWGNMHWGHAVSRDLVHWEELPVALYPDALGTMFSGSAVVDTENALGLGGDGRRALVAFYTAAGGTSRESEGQPFTQCMAYSLDGGRTFTKYEGNPVLPHVADANRDPKVFHHTPSGRWIMALYLTDDDFALFGSPDLKHWEKLCDVEVPGSSECPEFFEIPVEGRPDQTRWVFYGGNGHYRVGRFDGTVFTPESGPHVFHYGNCFYASQTFNNVPDGRRIQIAWGQVTLQGPFNQQMDFPTELTLHETPDGHRLRVWPVREIASLYRATRTVERQALVRGIDLLEGVEGELLDVEIDIDLGDGAGFRLTLDGRTLSYDLASEELSLAALDPAAEPITAPLSPVDGRIALRLLIDRASVEVYANGGEVYLPVAHHAPEKERTLTLAPAEEGVTLASALVRTLNSAWR